LKEIVLTVEKLTVYRETHQTLVDVSFVLESGTDTAIVGPNGGGKTTLVEAILGILPRQSGHITLLGQPLSHSGYLPPDIRQQIAYLPQNFGVDRLIPMTVAEMVGLGWGKVGLQWPWANYKNRQSAVKIALERVNGSHLSHQLIGGLSGGETKRMLLAYCLVSPRRLLILDEAPAGLDTQAESAFYQLLYQLKKEQNWAILQISHDLEMVRQHCDRVLCVNHTLRCQGTPEVALSADAITAVYGAEFIRYHHSHTSQVS